MTFGALLGAANADTDIAANKAIMVVSFLFTSFIIVLLFCLRKSKQNINATHYASHAEGGRGKVGTF